jgi:hypothetical protein
VQYPIVLVHLPHGNSSSRFGTKSDIFLGFLDLGYHYPYGSSISQKTPCIVKYFLDKFEDIFPYNNCSNTKYTRRGVRNCKQPCKHTAQDSICCHACTSGSTHYNLQKINCYFLLQCKLLAKNKYRFS